MALKVNTCCGCCSVRTGALIIAILQITFSLLAIIGSAIALGVINSQWSEGEHPWDVATTPATYLSSRVSNSYGSSTSDKETEDAVMMVVNIVLGVLIVVFLVHLLFNVLLLCGILQNKASLVMAWVVYSGICLGISVASAIFSLFTMPLSLIQSLITIGLQLYFLAVVRSFHDTLKPSYDHMPIVNAENGGGPSMSVMIQTPPTYPPQQGQAYPYASDPTLPPPYATAVKQSMS